MKYRHLVPPKTFETKSGKKVKIALVEPAIKGKVYRGMGARDRERREKAEHAKENQLHEDGASRGGEPKR